MRVLAGRKVEEDRESTTPRVRYKSVLRVHVIGESQHIYATRILNTSDSSRVKLTAISKGFRYLAL